jgi:hypothetical protein
LPSGGFGDVGNRLGRALVVPIEPAHHTDPGQHRVAGGLGHQDQSLNGRATFRCRVLSVRHLGDVVCRIAQRSQRASVRQRDWIVEGLRPRHLSKQRRPAVGELHVGAALVPPQPIQRDGARDPGAEPLTATASREKRLIDALDIDAAILHRFDGVGQLHQLARGGVGVGEGTGLREISLVSLLAFSRCLETGGL